MLYAVLMNSDSVRMTTLQNSLFTTQSMFKDTSTELAQGIVHKHKSSTIIKAQKKFLPTDWSTRVDHGVRLCHPRRCTATRLHERCYHQLNAHSKKVPQARPYGRPRCRTSKLHEGVLTPERNVVTADTPENDMTRVGHTRPDKSNCACLKSGYDATGPRDAWIHASLRGIDAPRHACTRAVLHTADPARLGSTLPTT